MKRCAFCGKPTNYWFYELNCYICIDCLAKYKNKRKLRWTPKILSSFNVGKNIEKSMEVMQK